MKRLCIIICNSLAPEISHILQNGDYPEVRFKSFPAVCVGCTMTDQRISKIIGDNPDQYSKIVVILSSCRGKKNFMNTHLKNLEIIHLEQCFEIIFPLPTIYHCINQGNYLVSNGWLRNYNHKIREWGFDAASAKSFFGESIRKILLLETGLPGDYQTNLTALSEYMGVPYDILPIGTSHLKSFLDTIILDWKNEAERKMQNSRIAKLARESADYSLIFNHLKNLIDHTDEQIIIREITSLLQLLLVPERLVYHQYVNGIETNTTEPSLPNTSSNSEDSITIEITHQNETLGMFEVIKVRFPQFIPQYKPMEQVISQIGGLAISNARKYSELESTRTALAFREEHFRTMFEQAPLGIALVDSLTGKIKSVNSKFAEIAGRSRDEMRTIDWMSITHPDDIQEDLDNMVRLNAGEIAGFQMNKRYLKPDGSIVWINMTIEPINVENKANPFHLCMIEDITDRKMAEEAISKSEVKHRKLINHLTAGVVVHAPDTKILFANNAASEILGLTWEQMQGKAAIDKEWHFTKEDETPLPLEEYPVMKTISTLQPLENFVLGIKRPLKGDLVWVLINAYPEFDENTQLRQVVISFVDITIQKEALINLAKNNLKFRNLSHSATEMINLKSVEEIYDYLTNSLHEQYPNEVILFLKIDEENQISKIQSIKGVSQKLINQAMKLTGYDFYKKSFRLIPEFNEMFKSGVFHQYAGGLAEFAGNQFPQMAAKAIEKLLGIRQIYTIGITNGDKLFAIIHFLNRSKNPITDSEYIESFVKQAGIVIERKQAEEQLRQSEALLREMNATKDKFFSIISHDLRGPLASILSLTGLIADNYSDFSPEDLQQFTRSIHKTTESTFNLLQNLLEWSRMQRGLIPFNPETVNLKAFIGDCDESVQIMAKSKSVGLNVYFPEELVVMADPNMLKAIVRNLVMNAIKFTPRGGRIDITANIAENNTVWFSVKDTGIGMSKELIDNLFKIDKNVSRPGTDSEPSAGLGLILCKEFVEKHKGQIWIESEVGKGSTFYFTIPTS